MPLSVLDLLPFMTKFRLQTIGIYLDQKLYILTGKILGILALKIVI